ncbi:hypothetical protein ACQPX6_22610 [Actinomycetospora sp. CA-101289]|uniref:hypothetical protein n=1 Tax=Actinomycetospora sp. CA-101289 TaxID=3239893 RepID=UPI003D967BC6
MSAPWVGMYGAAAFPGTALTDEEFRGEPVNKVLGVESDIFIGAVCLTVLGIAFGLERRSRH